MTDASLAFLSWVRAGLGAGGSSADPLSGALPVGPPVSLRFRVNQRAEQALTARLYGPGDVTALDPRQIIRTDPRPGDDTFPPNLFPAVEFDRPDLPWLLTPALAATRDRLRPWLVLVVVDRDDAELVPGGALPELRCKREQLPNLDESWLWAHAQVALDGSLTSARVDQLLSGAPERTLARLLCPRHLRPQRRYLACVVPAFEAGRKTGLRLPLTAADTASLQPAWSPGTGPAPPLPVYHHWEFATADAGDFETLVNRLEGRPLPQTVGVRPLDVADPGSDMPAVLEDQAGRLVDLEGALRSPATFPGPWEPTVRTAFEQALRQRLESNGDEVVPPVYGLAHAGRRAFSGDGDAVPWLRRLNLDPRYRAIAALGTLAVQEHQEDLIAAAWEQAIKIEQANQALRQGQLGRSADQAIYDRRISTARPGVALPDDRLLALSAPVHSDLPVGVQVRTNRAVQAASSAAFRKATRPGASLARRAGAGVAKPLPRLAAKTANVTPPLPVPPGIASVEVISTGETMAKLTPDRVKKLWWENTAPGPQTWPAFLNPRLLYAGALMPQRVFATTTDGRVLSRGPSGSWLDHGRPPNTMALNHPTALRDLHVFVAGADRHLWELGWDGDRWAWSQHPLPNGLKLAYASSPRGTWSDSSPVGGGVWQNRPTNNVWVVDENGSLWQHVSLYGWANRGNNGHTLNGRIGGAGPWSILVTSSSGRLLGFEMNTETAAWSWRNYGYYAKSDGTSYVGALDKPAGLSWPFRWARSTDGKLLQYGVTSGGIGWTRVRSDHGTILGVVGSEVYIATTSGQILSGVPTLNGAAWTQRYPAPPGLPSNDVPRGEVRPDGRVIVVVDGKLVEGSAGQWAPAVVPNPGGAGPYNADPPVHDRWRPTLGFMSNMVAAHVDAAHGGDRLHTRIGRDVDFEAHATSGWHLRPAMPDTIGLRGKTQGMGIALGDIKGRGGGEIGRRDLLPLWVEDTAGGNFPSYRVGFDLDAQGTPSSWSGVKRCPTPVITYIGTGGGLTINWRVQAADVDLGDLDGDGKPELVMAYVTSQPTPRAFYRIGWSLDANGDVTRGWSESQPVPPPAGPLEGMGVAVADMTGDLRPDLVVLYVERTSAGLSASYRIGYGLNARGYVIGPWSNPIPVGGGPLPAAAQGAALAVADFSGSERPDLAVLVIDNGPTDNVGQLRIAWDVNAATGVPRRWSDSRQIGGWWGWENRGAGLAIGDVDPTLLAKKRTFGEAFRTRATAQQELLQKAQNLADEADAQLVLNQVAAAARTQLEPGARVDNRVADRVDGVDLTKVNARDRLNPLLAAPSFDTPTYELVTELGQELLLPGIADVPPDTVSLLRANPAFIEAFLVGLNHEMGRELLWREFPTDRRATFFRHFWDARGGVPLAGPLTDIPPIDAWRADAALGDNATAVGGPDMAILVIRGELLRRHPTATVLAIRAVSGGAGRPRMLGTERRLPQFRGRLDPDIAFFGFPLSVAQARGTGNDPGWFFAFQEQPTEPRFGLDEPPRGAAYGQAPVAWNHAHWGSIATSAEDLAQRAHVPLDVPFPRGSQKIPVRDDVPTKLAFWWGENAAHTAHITLQRPVLLAIHATDLLPGVSGEWRITHVVKRAGGDPRRRIRAVAGKHPDGRWWRLSLEEAVTAIRLREKLYVEEPAGDRVPVVVVRGREGREYLRTKADSDAPNNLLALPSLPEGVA